MRAGGSSVAVPYHLRRRPTLAFDRARARALAGTLPERARAPMLRGIEAEIALTSLR
jgi:hypothetical protein